MGKLKYSERNKIANELKKGLKSQRKLAREYGIGKSSIQRIKTEFDKENDENINVKDKENSGIQSEEVTRIKPMFDEKVFELFQRLRSRNFPINGPTIKRIALKIAAGMNLKEFKASNGWLEKFKIRHCLNFKTLSGEMKSVDTTQVENFRNILEEKINEYGYSGVYNCDETSLFYRTVAKKSFVTAEDLCIGTKAKKDRLTLLLCCNMEGSQYKPLIIGKHKKPRCFGNINLDDFNIKYDHSTNAWMTRNLFQKWLLGFNEDMKNESKKVLLLLDNAPSHICEDLSNVEVLLLPKNTTPILQPLDMGIIKAFKNHYNNALILNSVGKNDFDAEETMKCTTILDAMYFCSNAWEAISTETIKNCFQKAFNNPKTLNFKLDINSSLDLQIETEIKNLQEEIDVESELISDEDESKQELELSNFYAILERCKEYTLEFSPGNIKEFFDFRSNVMKNLKKTHGFGTKITDFFK